MRTVLLPVSLSAIDAALAIDWPTAAFGPVSGTSNAMRWRWSGGSTAVMGASSCLGGATSPGLPFGTTPAQLASSIDPRIAPTRNIEARGCLRREASVMEHPYDR
jgi:hypothetical protein